MNIVIGQATEKLHHKSNTFMISTLVAKLIIRIANEMGMLQGIAILRAITNCSLLEAKDFIEKNNS